MRTRQYYNSTIIFKRALTFGLGFLFAAGTLSPTNASPQKSEQLVTQGEDQASNGEWHKAAETLLQAIHEDDGNPDAYYDLSVAYVHMGLLAEARTAVERALKLQANFVDAQIQLANIYDEMGDKPDAEKWVKRAHITEHIQAADKAFADGDSHKAKEYLLDAIRIDPERKEPYFKLGVILGSEGDTNAQIENENKALDIDSSYAPAHASLAWAQTKLGGWQDAREQFDAALELDPKMTDAIAGKAIILSETGEQDKAKELLTTALKNHEKNALLHLAMSVYLSNGGDKDGATSELAYAIRLHPSALSLERYGSYELHKHNPELALQVYLEMIEQNNQSQSGWVGVGLAKLAMKDQESAIRFIKEARDLDPENASVQATFKKVMKQSEKPVEAKKEDQTETKTEAKAEPKKEEKKALSLK